MRHLVHFAVHRVVAQFADGDPQRRGEFLLIAPDGQAVARELLFIGQQVPDVAVLGAKGGREQAVGLGGRHVPLSFPEPHQVPAVPFGPEAAVTR